MKVILRESISAENIKSGQNVIQQCKCLKCKQKMLHILTTVVRRIMDSYRQILMFSKISFQVTEKLTRRCSIEKLPLEMSQKIKKNVCAGVSLIIKLQAQEM